MHGFCYAILNLCVKSNLNRIFLHFLGIKTRYIRYSLLLITLPTRLNGFLCYFDTGFLHLYPCILIKFVIVALDSKLSNCDCEKT